jgi:hypothetical protein
MSRHVFKDRKIDAEYATALRDAEKVYAMSIGLAYVKARADSRAGVAGRCVVDAKSEADWAAAFKGTLANVADRAFDAANKAYAAYWKAAAYEVSFHVDDKSLEASEACKATEATYGVFQEAEKADNLAHEAVEAANAATPPHYEAIMAAVEDVYAHDVKQKDPK